MQCLLIDAKTVQVPQTDRRNFCIVSAKPGKTDTFFTLFNDVNVKRKCKRILTVDAIL